MIIKLVRRKQHIVCDLTLTYILNLFNKKEHPLHSIASAKRLLLGEINGKEGKKTKDAIDWGKDKSTY